MKPTRLAHVSFLAMTLAAAGLGAGAARADIITLDLSGTMTPPFSGRGDCSPMCTLGGNIVIDNSVGAARLRPKELIMSGLKTAA